MRLDALEHGHGRRNATALRLMRFAARAEPDDVVKTSLYRPALFGRSWIALLRDVLRGPSVWSPGEREVIGAFTSRLNRCPYCAAIHGEMAALCLDVVVTSEMLDHIDDAGFDPGLTAVLHYIEKTVREPDSVGPDDIRRVRDAGVSDEGIVDALHVSFVFNVINRVANTFDFTWSSEAETTKAARVLNRMSYQLPGFLLRG